MFERRSFALRNARRTNHLLGLAVHRLNSARAYHPSLRLAASAAAPIGLRTSATRCGQLLGEQRERGSEPPAQVALLGDRPSRYV